MRKLISTIISMALNLLIVVFTIISIVSFFIVGGDGNMTVVGTKCFRYFTMDSNIFLCLTSIMILCFEILKIVKREIKLPKIMTIIRFAGVVSTTVTLIVVLTFLGPTMGYKLMFEGNNLFMHLLNPLFGIIAFCFTEDNIVLEKKDVFWGLSSVVIYGMVYVFNVLIIKVWVDFYGFNSGILQDLWFITLVVMLLATVGISFGIYYIRKLRK